MLLISPHRNAPIFDDENPGLTLKHAIDEISSGNWATNDENRALFRQAGFVNLWFFLYFIAGFSGPFELINTSLHIDMCNFRQEMVFPGSRAAGFLGRGHFKSTIFTEGAPAWILLRDPDMSIIILSITSTRSQEFMHTVQRIYDSNELFQWLYPEYVPEKGQKRWNDEEMVLPNRPRNRTEPNFNGYGVFCSTAGIHSDLLAIDDPMSDVQLDAGREPTEEAMKIGNWIRSNLKTLIKNELTSQVFYTSTRYGETDCHKFLFDSIKEKRGYWEGLNYKEIEEGEWIIYNRMSIENGKSIFKDQKFLDDLKRDDPWTYWVQYMNCPSKGGLNEFYQFKPNKFSLIFDEENGWGFRHFYSGEEMVVWMRTCDVILSCDPGASEKKVSLLTSRSAILGLAHAPDDRRFLFTLRVGYVAPSRVFDWLFELAERFQNYLRRTIIETQGPFRILDDLLSKEEIRRANEAARAMKRPVYLNKLCKSKTGDKIAMIRTACEPVLRGGLLYIEDSIFGEVDEELSAYPMGKNDILDALSQGLRNTIRPLTEEEYDELQEMEDEFENRNANAAGY